jgi:hypothetical protein
MAEQNENYGAVLGICNPLLDISVNAEDELFKKSVHNILKFPFYCSHCIVHCVTTHFSWFIDRENTMGGRGKLFLFSTVSDPCFLSSGSKFSPDLLALRSPTTSLSTFYIFRTIFLLLRKDLTHFARFVAAAQQIQL